MKRKHAGKRMRNPVAKNLEQFNRPATHSDRRKDQRRGYRKHKGVQQDD
jgi:hypothetical protein